ncbi:hypothetical protein HOLleu_42784 [Holothuria leucospilota]|uniref:Tyrosine-protein kinase ephrin type A/B receptor-like domain-containing protein n=1 Tax=Holothuria leucospilota TaxID=206669 RepID=A0A9Q1B9Z3_HOLLE|nr:hypothetical protein HOLleu_42784 [Holothuria leucospilota]
MEAMQREGFFCMENKSILYQKSFECTPCQRGTYGDGAGGCPPCPQGGYFQDGIGSIPILQGEMECKTCPNGTYAKLEGATSIADCKVCPDGTNKKIHAGFRACHCLDNYARSDRFGPCFPCLEGYNCSGNDYKSLRPGFYWNWSFDNASLSRYKRFVNNLRNETKFFSNVSPDTRYPLEIPQVFRCPRFNNCKNAPGALEVSCLKGYRGWLCSKCAKGFFSVMSSCLPCPGSAYFVVEIIVFSLILLAIILLAVRQNKTSLNVGYQRRNVFDMVLSRGKIVLGFYQVVGEFFISFHEINFIGSLFIIGELFALLEMNILRLFVKPQCIHEKLVINPKIEFIIGMSFPCVSILIAVVVWKVKIAYFKYRHPSLANGRLMLLYRYNLKTKIVSCVLVLLFLTYPSICTTIFQLYPPACQKFCLDVNKVHCIYLLRSDFDINCKELTVYHISSYVATVGYVIAFPAILYVFLRKKIHANHFKLFQKDGNSTEALDNSTTRDNSTETEMGLCSDDVTPVWINFLCENYKPQYWYWEIVELARKVIQTFLITMLGRHNNFTVLLTIGIAVSFLILHARFLPMKSKFEQGLQVMFSLVAVFINVLLAAMRVPVKHSGPLSIALTILNVVVISIIVGEAVLGLIHHLRRIHFLQTVISFLVRLKT